MADQEVKLTSNPNAAAQKLAAEEAQKIKDAFEEVAQTEAGQILFGYLMKKCLFHETTLAMSAAGTIDVNAMIHNEARRRLYLREVRPLIPVNIRRRIEN